MDTITPQYSYAGYDIPKLTFEEKTKPKEPAELAYETITVKKWIPAQEAKPAIAATPGSPAQVAYLLNKGWNTWARSIDQVVQGTCVEYSVNAGSAGAFIGIGPKNKDGFPLSQFTYGVICDLSGVHAIENGLLVNQITPLVLDTTLIRVYIQNSTVTYLIITDVISKVYKSLIPSSNEPMYAYGYLFASGDVIKNAAIKTGEIQFGKV